jgi:hypothetical protein
MGNNIVHKYEAGDWKYFVFVYLIYFPLMFIIFNKIINK